MHAGGRRKGKGRSRILYWFRTPPGVRVGRAALDEEAIRLIEEFNPEVEFDWTRILKGQGAEPKAAAFRERDHRTERGRLPDRPGPVHHRPAAAPPAPALVDRFPDVASPGSDLDFSYSEDRDLTPDVVIPDVAGVETEPAPLVAELAELGSDLEFSEPENRDLTPPSHARLGSEGLARLRARYAEVLARISERVPEPARQEELKARAERLNPDSWVTDAEVTAGLEAYESVFDGLRSAIGGPTRRRRRKRRRGGGQPAQPSGGDPLGSAPADTRDSTAPSAGQADEDDDEDL